MEIVVIIPVCRLRPLSIAKRWVTYEDEPGDKKDLPAVVTDLSTPIRGGLGTFAELPPISARSEKYAKPAGIRPRP